jgi:hypothetical protein
MVSLFHRQKCILYVQVFERNDIPNNLHFFHTLHTNAAMKQKKSLSAHGLL